MSGPVLTDPEANKRLQAHMDLFFACLTRIHETGTDRKLAS